MCPVEGLLSTLVLLLVFAAGYAVQRGSICAVAAIDAMVSERRLERFLAFLLCAAVALAVMTGAGIAGIEMLARYGGTNALLVPALGGALFGAGAWVNGACAFGTVARLGGGDLARVGTLAGLFGGFALIAILGGGGPHLDRVSPLVGMPAVPVFAGALVAIAVLVWTVHRQKLTAEKRNQWSPLAAMTVIGLVNGVLLVAAREWPYTNLLMDLARLEGMALAWRGVMAAIFVTGAVAAAVVAGKFRLDIANASSWAHCVAGGLLMGIGATLVPGGNDTMLLVGLPLLLPNLVVAYGAMAAAMLVIAMWRRPRPVNAPA
jgi:uncharacterized protein